MRFPRFCMAAAMAAAVLLDATPAAAHEKHPVGRLQLTIGWEEEPAFTGSKNAVALAIADAKGTALADAGGVSLSVEVLFGDERVVLPLQPVWGRPGEFRAWLIPTRAGTYSFHITGKIKDQPVDVRSTCSEKTFDCVSDASTLHFPVKDPSTGQLAESVSRALPRADRAAAEASRARTLAIAGLAVAVLALGAAIGFGARKGVRGA
jgi:hypothetical protein